MSDLDVPGAGIDEREAAGRHLEKELSVLLRRARSLSMTFARQIHPGLDAAEYTLLSALLETGDTRAADLASLFALDKSTVSRQLAEVEAMGLVERRADPLDGRVRVIRLTDVGRERVQAVRERRREWLRGSLQGWSTDELEALARLLESFNASIEAPGDA